MSRRTYFKTDSGEAILGDSLEVMQTLPAESIDLVITSPPFDLAREKEYGNLKGDHYLEWLEEVGSAVFRVLKPSGSFVLDLGGSWTQGLPTRNLYQFRALLRLVDNTGFHLAQDFYWWNPSRLPTPAEWVTIRRIRVKDAINTIWWLSKTPYPKASNRRVLTDYSDSMTNLFQVGYNAKTRPSGHRISKKFRKDNGGAIPPNLLAIANTDSGSAYLRYCEEKGIAPHPARFPNQIPGFFIRFLTDRGDRVLDPFAGSCATGEVAEVLGRQWLGIEIEEKYLQGAKGRFVNGLVSSSGVQTREYRINRVGQYSAQADNELDEPLPPDGGRRRASKK